MRVLRYGMVLSWIVFAGAIASPASGAGVAQAGWQLFANTYPTNLVPGVNAVQEVTPGAEPFELTFEGATTSALAPTASPSAVQAALEALTPIGAGNVAVSADPEHAGTYLVTFTGLLGRTKVAELSGSGASTGVKTKGSASGTIGVDVFNVGAGASNGTITVTDTLPAGVKAKEAGDLIRVGRAISEPGEGFGIEPFITPNVWDCTGNGPGPSPKVSGASVVSCTNDPVGLGAFAGGGGLPTSEPNEELANPQPVIGIAVEAESPVDEPQHQSCVGQPSYCNKVSIEGGGALERAETETPVTVNAMPPTHGGLASATAWFSKADGTVDRQAGSHPYTATFAFNAVTARNAAKEGEGYLPGSEIRDLATSVPPGVIGDLHSMPECRQDELVREACPPSTMVGNLALDTFAAPLQKRVFNMVPPPGTPAELGFVLANTTARITFSVRTGGDYGITAHVDNIPQREVFQSLLTLWGTPEDATHDRWRGVAGGCTLKQMEEPVFGKEPIDYCARLQGPVLHPFLTLPTSCGAPQQFTFRELSGWQEAGATSEVSFATHDALGGSAGFVGCEDLSFAPAFATVPSVARADTAAGLIAEVTPPLGGLDEPGALRPADIRKVKVVLPEGFVINPGQAAGLQACPPGRPTPAQPRGDALTTALEKERGEEDNGPSSCPAASKVGTVEIKSPLIESAVEKQINGNVYVLQSNPPDVKLLIAGSADGVNVKLPGTVHLNEQTGRVEAVFEDTPQIPFSSFRLDFSGPQQALTTPGHCGTYPVDAGFTPWGSPLIPDFDSSSGFAISEGAGGTACPPSPLPFAPTLAAGSTNDQAGGFTSFSTLLQRGDGEQRVDQLRLTTPKGFAGMISSVPLCGEPQAQQGTCSALSRIGHAIVTAGPGANPLTIPQPGEPEVPIYLTRPYKGAPFGLTIVTPVIAGPFNLGTIVTRAKLEVDPHTAQVTIATDPLPQIVKGVPTDLRSIYAVIDRSGFTFNPTNCEPQASSAVVSGTAAPGAGEPSQVANVSSRFAVGGCRGLGFSPTVAVSTAAKASRLNGASLKFKISYPKGAFSRESWFHEAKFVFPKQLPARLPTLHQACDATIFQATRGSCPKHSVIGHAVVHTPVLPVPLEGPVYFVSHKNASFPDAVVVLSGDNLTVELKGETLIRHGITSATFRGLPDVPFETFEVTLPSGEFSEFGAFLPGRANNSFCGQKLVMPTTLVAQNGLQLNQSRTIAVTGCRKAHKHRAKRHAKRRHARPGH